MTTSPLALWSGVKTRRLKWDPESHSIIQKCLSFVQKSLIILRMRKISNRMKKKTSNRFPYQDDRDIRIIWQIFMYPWLKFFKEPLGRCYINWGKCSQLPQALEANSSLAQTKSCRGVLLQVGKLVQGKDTVGHHPTCTLACNLLGVVHCKSPLS